MNCEKIQPNLLDFGRGLLSGPEANEIKEHLAQCKECSALLEEELAFAEELSAIPSEQPQNDVWALVREKTKTRPILPFQLVCRRFVFALTTLAILFAVLYDFAPGQQVQTRPNISQSQNVSSAMNWSDDPVGQHTDAMLASIDNM